MYAHWRVRTQIGYAGTHLEYEVSKAVPPRACGQISQISGTKALSAVITAHAPSSEFDTFGTERTEQQQTYLVTVKVNPVVVLRWVLPPPMPTYSSATTPGRPADSHIYGAGRIRCMRNYCVRKTIAVGLGGTILRKRTS
ncbi:hypothetical protein NUW58_g3908 [Xylaria curta]|uniref:Uncharacterized protein n=1 Tax=Xylaria curta TaxID=42375 RepID=A0ACC1PA97_9PEZI|nr:hypothetical protein NUW58_g3908 [Xylaria curta]